MVDIARSPAVAKKKKIRRIIIATAVLVGISGVTFAVSQLKPAAPSVDRAAVWVDTVKRGEMMRLVRGSGTLVPEDIRWINTDTPGRVERIVLRPGAQVTPTSVILELSNPDLENSVRDAQLAHASAVANFANRKAELERNMLEQQSQVAQIETLMRKFNIKLD